MLKRTEASDVLLQRVVTGVLAAALVLWAVWVGGPAFYVVVAAVVALCASELYRLMRSGQMRASLPVMVVGALGFVVIESMGMHSAAGDYAAILLLVLLFGHLLGQRMAGALAEPTAVFAATVYAGLPLSQLIRIRMMEPSSVGLGVIMMVLSSVWACDIGAYLFGSAFGRHKLAPKVSPAKSVEGAIAGLICAVLASLAINAIDARVGLWYAFDPARLAAFSLVIGVAAQIGDLVESMFKRSVSAKDSGGLLPGHGGVLDRCDSMIAAGAIAHLAAAALLF